MCFFIIIFFRYFPVFIILGLAIFFDNVLKSDMYYYIFFFFRVLKSNEYYYIFFLLKAIKSKNHS